jgi:hypothetical protein
MAEAEVHVDAGGAKEKEEDRARRDAKEEDRARRDEKKEERRSRAASKKADAIVIDLGRKPSKDVRDLRKGRGRLLDDVEDSIDELREAGALSATAQPIIVIVERRISARAGMLPFLLPPGAATMFPFGMKENDDDDD